MLQMLKVENERHNNKMKNKRNKIDDMYAFCLSKNSIVKGGKAEVSFLFLVILSRKFIKEKLFQNYSFQLCTQPEATFVNFFSNQIIFRTFPAFHLNCYENISNL